MCRLCTHRTNGIKIMNVRKGVSALQKVSKIAEKLQSKKCDFSFENMKNTVSPKLTSKGV